jgi:5-formyltetrahydrofolate cyclo-ligase
MVVNNNTRSERLRSETINNKKNNLRKIFIKKRKNISLNCYGYSEQIANKFLLFIKSNPIIKFKYNLGLYWQLGSEVDTRPIIAALIDFDFKIAILSSEKNNFKFRNLIPNQSIQKNKLGYETKGSIMSKPDIIVCPILCFDKKCNRLGRGGGHYDRFLKSYPKAIKIGLAYSEQMTESVYPEKHDIKMDIIVTEKKVYSDKDNLQELY